LRTQALGQRLPGRIPPTRRSRTITHRDLAKLIDSAIGAAYEAAVKEVAEARPIIKAMVLSRAFGFLAGGEFGHALYVARDDPQEVECNLNTALARGLVAYAEMLTDQAPEHPRVKATAPLLRRIAQRIAGPGGSGERPCLTVVK
jgi:hypothetical protein